MRRRAFLAAIAGTAAVACAPRAVPRAPEHTLQELPSQDVWAATARDILVDGLQALRAYDEYAAYRATLDPASSLRSRWELPWSPPAVATWRATTERTYGLRARASGLEGKVAYSVEDPALWRERRSAAEGAALVVDFVDALVAYRARVDHLSPGGDGSGALPLLTTAWERWNAAAAAWDVTRAERLEPA